ncbi:class I SAM-dependent methyltransferase [Reichenbachiella sp. MALMAid0571]|uniref:class I SAM-dependent methyltransferase n=1 Tax=Reichenbachiella sp. MALMAid0571 TaxID=3143939 RepID=UPI0032DF1301
MKIDLIAGNLVKDENGIFVSGSKSKVSYPETGNQDSLLLEQDSFWFDHRNRFITEAVKKFSSNSIFYDIGGGNGFVSKGLQEVGIETVLVEPGYQGCLNAKKREVEKVICSTLENAGFQLGTLESAGMFDVIEHIKDDKQFLVNIHGYLKDDGKIYITVPSYNFLWSNEDIDAGHFRRYTLINLSKMIETCGFRIEYSTYLFSFLPVPVFLFRTLPSLLGLNKNSNKLSKHKKEHKPIHGWSKSILDKVLQWELKKIRSLNKIPFGGSCFVVASK